MKEFFENVDFEKSQQMAKKSPSMQRVKNVLSNFQDFPSMEWFLAFCFGDDAPEGSMVHRCRDVTDDNMNDLVKEFPIPFAHLKSRAAKLTNESKARIAGYEKLLDTVLW